MRYEIVFAHRPIIGADTARVRRDTYLRHSKLTTLLQSHAAGRTRRRTFGLHAACATDSRVIVWMDLTRLRAKTYACFSLGNSNGLTISHGVGMACESSG